MNILGSLKRPEYIFRPAQMIRRVLFALSPRPTSSQTVLLPWGLEIRVQPTETMGSGIRRLGIHELPSSEFISRLIDPGEIAVDVGANIGHMTSVMAMRAGPSGKVIAFEPHPVLFGELQYNTTNWKRDPRAAPIEIRNLALSDYTGAAQLAVPDNFNANNGIAYISSDAESNPRTNHFEVSATTLRAAIGEGTHIGLLKIDVEGHELQVLKGAQNLLESGNIRDILFEELRTLPTPVTDFLERSGYAIYRVDGGFMGPLVGPTKTPYKPAITKDAPNYLATRDSIRLLKRMSKRGWAVYSRWK
jgi:FkbM family methyltransferase